MPLISVLMSVYARSQEDAEYLEASINSVLAQSFQDFEFIIINDGMTCQKALGILGSISDSRVKIINNSDNIGLTKSLNIGLDHAHGKFIARQDADDISLPERFKTQLNYFKDNVGLVGTWASLIDAYGLPVSGPWCDIVVRSNKQQLVDYFLNDVNPIVAPSVMLSRRAIKSVGYFDPVVKYAQDYNYWLRLIRIMDFEVVPEILVLKRLHPNGIWVKDKPEEYKDIARKRAIEKPYIPLMIYV